MIDDNPSPEEQAEALFQEWLSAFADGEEPATQPYFNLAEPAAHPFLAERFESFRRTQNLLSQGQEQLLPGKEMSGFRLIRILGQGGMGAVWEAEELQLQRRVALKVLPPLACLAPRAMERFRREAVSGAKVPHPGVVRVLASGVSDGVHWIAQELVGDGRTLADEITDWRESRVQREPKEYFELAEFFAKVVEAVGAAHEAGVVHRDLKPSNILLSNSGRPMVADFGLAQNNELNTVTQSLGIAGTAPYLSPEQLEPSLGRVGKSSDVFALGVTLYEALTLLLPFPGDHSEQIARKTVRDEPVRPCDHASRIPRDLETICLKALEKNPKNRFANAEAFAHELRRFLAGDAILARRPSALEQITRWAKRRPWRAVASVLFVVAFAGVMTLLVMSQAATLRAERALKGMERALLQAQSFVDLKSPMDLRGQTPEQKVAMLVNQRDLVVELLADRPEMQARVLIGVGRGFLWLEQFEHAIDVFERAKELLHEKDALLEEQVSLLLGWALGRAHRCEQAMVFLNSVVASPLTDSGAAMRKLWARNRLGQVLLHLTMADSEVVQLYDKDQCEEIRRHPKLKRALNLFLEVKQDLAAAQVTDEHPLAALNWLDLGIAYKAMGQFSSAKSAYQHAELAYLSAYGPSHPELVFVKIGQGSLASVLSEDAEALTYYESALQLSRDLYGPKHETTIESMCHLGRFLAAREMESERFSKLYHVVKSAGHTGGCMDQLQNMFEKSR